MRILEYLLQNGAGLEAPDPNGRTPLHYSVIFGKASATALLLRRGANRYGGVPSALTDRQVAGIEPHTWHMVSQVLLYSECHVGTFAVLLCRRPLSCL